MEGIWPIIFLGLVLKIPVVFSLWLVWWAGRSYDEFAEDEAPGGAEDPGFRRWRRSPRHPRGPRRGPHGGAARALPDCPPGGRRRGVAPPQPLPALGTHEDRASPRRA